MPRKGHSPEQILNRLREVEVGLTQGRIPQETRVSGAPAAGMGVNPSHGRVDAGAARESRIGRESEGLSQFGFRPDK